MRIVERGLSSAPSKVSVRLAVYVPHSALTLRRYGVLTTGMFERRIASTIACSTAHVVDVAGQQLGLKLRSMTTIVGVWETSTPRVMTW